MESPPPAEMPGLDYYSSRFEEFARDCLLIRDKSRRLVPFVLNSTQRVVLDTIDRLRAQGIPPRLVILKARQVGISTLTEALLFWACLCFGGTETLVIANSVKLSKALFRMSKRFYRGLPESLRQEKRIDNLREIEFDHGSRMEIEVQGDPRGYTAQGVHLSEFAMFDQPEDTLVAVMQSLPMSVESLGVIESTARGVGNKFHKLWQRAVGQSLDSQIPEDEKGWTPIFVPWFEHEEYRIAIKPGERLDPSSEEMHLATLYKLDERQMKWRRWCINTNLDGDEEKFAQEYPSTAEEAFSLSGRPAFDASAIRHYTNAISEASRKSQIPQRMEVVSDPPGIGEPEIEVYDRGRLRIFMPLDPQTHKPIDISRYSFIIGADPSEGDPGSDHSPLAILCQQTMDLVGTWYGKAPPDVLACIAIDLARMFNRALIINEANNHGILFHETVLELGYENLYFRSVSEDTVAGTVTQKPGFLNTHRNREHLFNTLRKYVRRRMGRLPCPHFVQQMQTLVYIDGRAQAQGSAEKDLLVAFALTLMAHRGSMDVPLAPLPEAEIMAVSEVVSQLRERDPEAAGKFSFDRLGMTQEQCDRAREAILSKERRQKRFGFAGMR